MCLEIYIGSDRKIELPENSSGTKEFSVFPLAHFGELNLIERILDSNYYYTVISYTGCACGLSKQTDGIIADPEKRKKDLEAFYTFLTRELQNNDLKLFCTWWKNLSAIYPSRSFQPENMLEPDFSFEEDVILQLVKSPVVNKVKQSS